MVRTDLVWVTVMGSKKTAVKKMNNQTEVFGEQRTASVDYLKSAVSEDTASGEVTLRFVGRDASGAAIYHLREAGAK